MKRLIIHCLIFYTVAGIILPVTAQANEKYGSLSGEVRDGETGRALSGVQLSLSAGLVTYKAKTDTNGRYSFAMLPVGVRFPMTVSCLQYKKVSANVTIQPGVVTHTDFTLSSVYLHLMYPNGGEKFFAGSEQHISWISVGITSLRLEFSINGGRDWRLITEHADASSGPYIWDVPDIPSTDYLIRITDTADENTYDVSDSTFSNDST